MRYRDLTEALDLDYDYDFDDDEIEVPKQPPLPHKQQRMLDLHRKKQDRVAFRAAEKRRRAKEEEIYAPEHDYYGVNRSRHVPKSAVGYKPFSWPMIRFGLFRERSKVGFDAEMRREMGNITHEAGVSCFRSVPHHDGYLIREHEGGSSWTVGFDPDKLLYPWLREKRPQFNRWLKTGTPMDIFVIHGHLVASGANDEWLTCGADGEYLIDTRKPHQIDHVDPDQLWLADRMTLRQYYATLPPTRADDEDELSA